MFGMNGMPLFRVLQLIDHKCKIYVQVDEQTVLQPSELSSVSYVQLSAYIGLPVCGITTNSTGAIGFRVTRRTF